MEIEEEQFVYRYKRVRDEVVTNLVQRNMNDHEKDLTEALLSGLKNNRHLVEIFCGDDGVKVEVNKQLLVIFSSSLRGSFASLGCCDGNPSIILPDFRGESVRNMVEILTNQIMKVEISSYNDINDIVKAAKALGIDIGDLKLKQLKSNEKHSVNQHVVNTQENVSNVPDEYSTVNKTILPLDGDNKVTSDRKVLSEDTVNITTNVAAILDKVNQNKDDSIYKKSINNLSESSGPHNVSKEDEPLNSEDELDDEDTDNKDETPRESDSEHELDDSDLREVQIVENEYLQNLNLEETIYGANRTVQAPASSDDDDSEVEFSSDEEYLDEVADELENIDEDEYTSKDNEDDSNELPTENTKPFTPVKKVYNLDIEDEALIEGPAASTPRVFNILDEIKNKMKMKDDISNKVKLLASQVMKKRESSGNGSNTLNFRESSNEDSLNKLDEKIATLSRKLVDFDGGTANHEVEINHASVENEDEIINKEEHDFDIRNRFRCTICNEVTKKPLASNLKEHLSQKHFSKEIFDRYIGDTNVRKCPVEDCGKSFEFKNRGNLVRHLGSTHNKCVEFLEENGVEIPEVLLESTVSEDSSPSPLSEPILRKIHMENINKINKEYETKVSEDSSSLLNSEPMARKSSSEFINNSIIKVNETKKIESRQSPTEDIKEHTQEFPTTNIKIENPDFSEGAEENFMDRFRCTICHEIMRKSSVSNFKEHYSTSHFRSEIFIKYIKHPSITACPECGKDFNGNRNNLIRHLGSTHGKCVELLEEKGIRVPSCFNDIKRKRSGTTEVKLPKKVKIEPPLMGHSIFHSEPLIKQEHGFALPDKFQCDYCDNTFANRSNLKRHMANKHQDD